MSARGWLLLALAWLLAAGSARGHERILDFHGDIVVAADAGMRVTETIRVVAEGAQIRHGIYRDFPTDYRDRYGNRVRVAFEPLALTRDGVAEPFHSERLANGVRVYFGASDTVVPPGEHVYAFTYHTTRQLGFFADHDELYWNLTGNGWDFLIEQASATVTLPGRIPPDELRLEAYTGAQGSKGRDWTAQADGPSRALFATTQALPPRHGLTIVVGFPKGIVQAPSREQRVQWLVADNRALLALGAGLLLVLGWYLAQWWRVGRDPRPGTIIPQYEPPAGHTPSALRYVWRMGWDDRCVAADLVDAAVRGAIRIGETDGTYRIERGADVALPPVERTLIDQLLGAAARFTFSRGQHSHIANALETQRNALVAAYSGSHFNTNTRFVVLGALITFVALVGAALLLSEVGETVALLFMLVWLSGWSVGVFGLSAAVIAAWRKTGRGPPGKRGATWGGALLLSLFALPFLIGEIAGIGVVVALVGTAFAIALVALLATNLLFWRLMKAPTATGRKLLDQIEGLRRYLGVAERDQLAALRAPPLTADEFNRMLPWALALEVEDNWTNRFAASVGPAAAAAAVAAAGWYRGTQLHNLGSFTSGIGSSFSGAISSSSTAPGSSSGGGGGGSSGGGGGGGGGGGW